MDWLANKPAIEGCDDGQKPFKYCPWCAYELVTELDEPIPDYIAAMERFSTEYADVFGDARPEDILEDIRG